MTDHRRHAGAVDALSDAERGQLLDALPIGAGVQRAGTIVYLNPAGARLLGGARGAPFVGRSMLDFVHPDDREAVLQRIRHLTGRGGTTLERSYVFLDLEGNGVPVLISAASLAFRGEPATLVTFSAGGQGRREQRELLGLRKAVDSSSDVIFTTDAAGLFTFINPEFTRVYGYESNELLNKTTPRILKSGLVPAAIYDQFWTTILSGQVARGEIINKTKSGRLITIDGSANPILGTDGDIAGFVAVQRDVTERQRRERLLNLTQFSLDNSLDAVLWFNADGSVHMANDTTTSLLGYTRGELEGMSIWDLSPSMSPGAWEAAWARLKQQGSAVRQTVHRHKDGTELPVEVSGRQIRFDGEDYLFASVRDIREREALSAQLQQAQKMEAVGKLAGGIAHDFNNLLAVILSYADFVAESVDTHDPVAADVLQIREAANRAAALTRQLLAFSRKQVMEPTTFRLGEVVGGMQKILQRVIGEDVNLAVLSAEQELFVTADVSQMEQVLMNLAVNARDAMPRGGALEIVVDECELDEAFVATHPGSSPGPVGYFSVRDTGIGMDATTCARAFEPFFTTKPVGQGTGLGLSTVYGIVKQTGGYVTLESEPGTGTTITIYLPKASAAMSGPRRMSPPTHTDHPLRGTILLVEDDDAVRRVIERALRSLGLAVLVASGPGEALLLHEQSTDPIDLLLSDIVMPTLSGVELARRLRDRQPALKVLLMTGHIDDKAIGDGLGSSGFALIRKPFTPESIRARISALLAGSPLLPS